MAWHLGKLNAAAERELANSAKLKTNHVLHDDPVEELRIGWDRHVAFGLANRELFLIMTSKSESPAAVAGLKILNDRIRAIAITGRLRISEARAVAMVHACCTGVILTLLANQLESAGLSQIVREAVIGTITNGDVAAQSEALQSGAITVQVNLVDDGNLTPGERLLLKELLAKLIK